MSAPTYSDFATRFPELASSVTADQTWIGATLSREWGRCDSGFWGTERTEACLLRAAHRWALLRQGGATSSGTGNTGTIPTGALSSISVGQWSATYTAPSNSRSTSDQQDYGRTTYGQEYLTLRDAQHTAFARVSR